MNKLLESEKKFEAKSNKKYKTEAIIYGMVYGKKTNNSIPNFYYLILWKGYPEKKSA